jgi:hypothetical protein
MNLLPKEYDFKGVEIPCAYILQSRIRERIEAMEGEQTNDKGTKFRIEELGLLDLALDVHISSTVREQEMYAEQDRIRKRIKESVDQKDPGAVTDTMK